MRRALSVLFRYSIMNLKCNQELYYVCVFLPVILYFSNVGVDRLDSPGLVFFQANVTEERGVKEKRKFQGCDCNYRPSGPK